MRLTHDDAGAGEPAVLLIHGWAFGNRSHLVPQFEHLSSRRRTILLDLPGHGGSDPAPGDLGFPECAAAIGAVLGAAGIDRAVVCGHSFGGRLAVEVAAAYPSQVVGAALLDPVILFPLAIREGAAMLATALESDGWLRALEAYFSRFLSPYDPPQVRSKVMAELGDVPRELAARVMRAGMATDGSEAMARMQCPLLVVRGGETPMDAAHLRELQPGAWMGAPVGTGHWMTLSVPEQVNAMLDRFLEIGIDPTRGSPAPPASSSTRGPG